MDLRKEIARKIKESGYSIRQVGRIVDVSHSTIASFLVGKKINFEIFVKIINGMDFDKEKTNEIISLYEIEVFGGKIGSFSEYNPFNQKKDIRLKELEKIQEQGKLPNQVPIYSSVSAGCGYTPEAEPMDWFSMNNRENLKGVLVSGESMEGTIPDKSVVFFKEDAEIKNGDIGVFLIEGEGYIKRFFKNKNIIILDSDNKDYPPIMVDEYSDFKICGKVVKVLSNV